ncbi:b(0,+)-type amino acid transporter 1-like [Asterias rubens]|uniref:b(0,+)-type amino acid transporter 1-like n=1 Tax=Asterias rubens TaxID=7604 RepID=UPI0014556A34|nr:b(0,+)-type amino acid transporter 1-like [Asterias rubens]
MAWLKTSHRNNVQKYKLLENISSFPETDSDEAEDCIHDDDDNKIGLKKEVGLIGGVALVVNSIIGSGIFVAPQGVLLDAQSVGMSMVVWVVCGIVASLGALCFAELGSKVPQSGGTYTYILLAYGDLPAFLVSWASTIIIKPASGALLSLTFGYYVAEYITTGSCPPADLAVKLFAMLALMMVVFINCMSVQAANSLQILFSVSKILVLTLIIITGFIMILKGQHQYLDPSVSFKSSSTDIFGYALAMYQGLWAFSGMEVVNTVAEEIVNSERNIPLAIFIAMPFITVVYLMTNVAYFSLLSPEEVLASSAVAVTFADRSFGTMAWVIPLGVCISTFGALLTAFLADSRASLAAGREGHMLILASLVTIKWKTPAPALVLQGVTVVALIMVGKFKPLFKFTGTVVWLINAATFFSVIILRYKLPRCPNSLKIPTLVPVLATLFSIYMILAPIIAEPTAEYLYAVLLMLLGVAFHTVFIRYGYHPKSMDSITRFFQKLFFAGLSSFESVT